MSSTLQFLKSCLPTGLLISSQKKASFPLNLNSCLSACPWTLNNGCDQQPYVQMMHFDDALIFAKYFVPSAFCCTNLAADVAST